MVSVNGLLILVFVLVAMLIIYLIIRKHMEAVPKMWPPNTFMKTTGSVCPDYWTFDRLEGDRVVCKNSYNIPMGTIPGVTPNWQTERPDGNTETKHCYVNEDNVKTKSFNKLIWPDKGVPKKENLRERCDWIRNCSYDTSGMTTDASWLGMDELCIQKGV